MSEQMTSTKQENKHDAPAPSAPPPKKTSQFAHAIGSQLAGRGFAVLALVIALGGAALFWRQIDAKPPAAVPPPPPALPVEVVTIANENVAIYPRFLGQTEGSQLVNIHARVAGHLTERSFKEGDVVKAGQKLFQIDPRPFQVELEIDKARLASAEATLDRARSQLKRYEELSTRQSTTAGELEDRQKEERVAAADVNQQKAQIESTQLQLSYTTISSPITGVVGQVLKDVGNYVDSGAGGDLAVVQQVEPIYVRFSVSELEILRRQQQVADKAINSPPTDQLQFEITLADGSLYPQRAKVNYLDVQVDQNTGTAVVRGAVANPDNLLRPGMFVYATITGQQLVNVIQVPQKAVLQSPAGAAVFVVNDKNIVEFRPVILGEWSSDNNWIIQKGLNAGDRVIIDRLPMVRPGASVAVVPTPAPTTGPTQ